jgi:hypothetical protein
MKLTGGNRSNREKTCPSATLSTTNPTWTDPGFFFPVRGFSPLIHFCTVYILSSFMSLYAHITVLTTNTTQTSMPPVGLEPTILVSERPKTHEGSNPGLRGGRPATNRLSHGTAYNARTWQRCPALVQNWDTTVLGFSACAHLGLHDPCNQHSFYREAAFFYVAFIKFYRLASTFPRPFAAVSMNINHSKAYTSTYVCIS